MTRARLPSILEKGGASTRTDVTTDFVYSGRAIPGSSSSAPVWLITRLDLNIGDLAKLHPDGKASFTNIWDDRASLNYF